MLSSTRWKVITSREHDLAFLSHPFINEVQSGVVVIVVQCPSRFPFHKAYRLTPNEPSCRKKLIDETPLYSNLPHFVCSGYRLKKTCEVDCLSFIANGCFLVVCFVDSAR